MLAKINSNPIEEVFIKNYISNNTKKTYSNAIENFYQKNINEITMEDLTNTNILRIRDYILQLIEKGLDSCTIKTRISALRSFFETLKSMEIVRSNPFKDKRISRFMANTLEKEDNLPKTEMITYEEYTKLINAIDKEKYTGKRDYLIIKTLASTGMRVGELVNFKTTDIELNDGKWYIHIMGKGRKHRIVQVSEQYIKELQEYLKMQLPTEEEKYVFTTIYETKFTEAGIRYIIKQYCEQVGLPNISPHSFRHFYITSLIMQGANLHTVQYYSGHSNINTTSRYFHKFDIYYNDLVVNV